MLILIKAKLQHIYKCARPTFILTIGLNREVVSYWSVVQRGEYFISVRMHASDDVILSGYVSEVIRTFMCFPLFNKLPNISCIRIIWCNKHSDDASHVLVHYVALEGCSSANLGDAQTCPPGTRNDIVFQFVISHLTLQPVFSHAKQVWNCSCCCCMHLFR